MSEETRDKDGVSRRDFLGLAAFGTAILGVVSSVAGSLRYIKANVYFEESKKFKVGTVENFPIGSVKKLDDKNVFIFSEEAGLFAISAICTHLGCIVSPVDFGFQCPCHGSQFNHIGNVIGGPAPRALEWFEISQEIDGSLAIDTAKTVSQGTKYLFA
ncbi:MAG: ubiquinol-cytochrome c reductase iron-sulfur subunit [Nitrospira sp.]|nr:ubiquinol-cytochrome c reductase iron-sulfur subunit [bacterium]MBL7048518.1 ubiquinol-cytochrome c reductase iron-sulfur subunit [Nitrospira sp.]